MWLYKPSADRWSIHEIILHLADSEASAYLHCRRFIAEPGSQVPEFDAARWASSLGYFHQSTREALEIIRRLRKMTYQLLAALPDHVWDRTVAHPRDGQVTLERRVEIQERHIPHHIDQMRGQPRRLAEDASAPLVAFTYACCGHAGTLRLDVRRRHLEPLQRASKGPIAPLRASAQYASLRTASGGTFLPARLTRHHLRSTLSRQ